MVSFASKYFFTTNVTYDLERTEATASGFFDGDISCEVGANNAHHLHYVPHCLNRGDLFTYFNWENPQYNSPHLNLYTTKRLWTGPYTNSIGDRFDTRASGQGSPTLPTEELHYMTHMITSDLSANWGVSVSGRNPTAGPNGLQKFHVYKFFPAAASTYNYVAECSNRGICDRDAGVCKCFAGYTADACNLQSSLAL